MNTIDAERLYGERIRKLIDSADTTDQFVRLFALEIEARVEREREACIKIVVENFAASSYPNAYDITNDIRARINES